MNKKEHYLSLTPEDRSKYLRSLPESERSELVRELYKPEDDEASAGEKWATRLGLLAIIVVSFVIIGYTTKCQYDKKVHGKGREPIQSYVTDSPARRMESTFEAAKLALALAVKENLKDPNSFQMLSSSRSITGSNGTTMVILIEYTATNSFGGRVRSTAIAECKTDGSDFKIISLSQ